MVCVVCVCVVNTETETSEVYWFKPGQKPPPALLV